MTARPVENPCSPCTAVMHYSSTSHGSVVSLVNWAIYVHSNLIVFCVSNPHAELALEASTVLSRRVVSENSRSSGSWRVFELGSLVLLMIARALEYRNNL